MGFCSNCGNQLPDDAKFCGKCGTPVSAQNGINIESRVVYQNSVEQSSTQKSINETATPFSGDYSETTNKVNEEVAPQPKPLPWVLLGVAAIILSVLAWVVKSTTATIVIAIGAIALSVFLLLKKAKPKALPIVAIVISGILIVAWCVHWTFFESIEDEEVTYQKVTFKGLEFTIPTYYKLGDNGNTNLDVYSVDKGKMGAFLVFGYGNAYDSGSAAAQLPSYISQLDEYQGDIDKYIDQGLDEAIKVGIDNIKGYNVEYVKDLYLAGTKAKEYKCASDMEGYTINVLAVASIDIMTGDIYFIIMGEDVEAENKYLSEFDGIIASAKYIDETKNNSNVSKRSYQNPSQNKQVTNGVSPDFKETMDSYENFFNDYIDFMKKYTDEGSSANAFSMLADYSEFMAKYADMMNNMANIDTSTLSAADSAYYLEVTARIYQKLAELQ